MPAPRTTIHLSPRSYEIRADGRVGSATLLNWFQEAAFANSTALGYPPERYVEMGVSWVMRENELLIHRYPRYGETLAITTWLADVQRVKAYRQYELQNGRGERLAHCNTQWVMLDLATQRPTRIPNVMQALFQPAQDFVLAPHRWSEVTTPAHRSEYRVPFWEEDEVGHVNNAQYVNWVEESARRAAAAAGYRPPLFRRHRLQYRLPAFAGDTLQLASALAHHAGGASWSHEVRRGDDLLLLGWSLSEPLLPHTEAPR